jgi:hypothetical protein
VLIEDVLKSELRRFLNHLATHAAFKGGMCNEFHTNFFPLAVSAFYGMVRAYTKDPSQTAVARQHSTNGG